MAGLCLDPVIADFKFQILPEYYDSRESSSPCLENWASLQRCYKDKKG